MRLTNFYPPRNDPFGFAGSATANDPENDISRGYESFPNGYGMPNVNHRMQVYMLPLDSPQSSWKVAGITMLFITLGLAVLFIFYCCVMRCYRKKKPVTEDEENAEGTPSGVNNEHRVSLPEELPPLDIVDKPTVVPASFFESPTLNVSQPYQPEPEDLARMQEIMLAKLEAPDQDWEIGHGDFDKKALY